RHALVSVLILSQVAARPACALYLALDRGKTLPSAYVWLAMLAGVGNAGGLIGFYKAAELGPLSVAAAIGAVGAVLPVTGGLASGETLRAPQAAGLALALGGAALAARRPPAGELELARYPTPRAGAVWAAGSALALGVFLTALPKASAHGRPWALFDARLAMVVLLAAWAGRNLAGIR